MLVAVPVLVLVDGVAALGKGVRMPAGYWLESAGWTLVALAPFVALGIWLGHQLSVDVLGPLTGALFAGLGLLAGSWVPTDQLPSAFASVARLLPAYWLVDARPAPLAGGWVGWHGLAVLAAWTVIFAVLGAHAFVRDTAGRSAAFPP